MPTYARKGTWRNHLSTRRRGLNAAPDTDGRRRGKGHEEFMRNIYVQVRLKPPPQKPARPISVTSSGTGKNKKSIVVPGHPGTFAAEHSLEWRTVTADTLGDACRKAEAMPDVLAVVATTFTKPE